MKLIRYQDSDPFTAFDALFDAAFGWRQNGLAGNRRFSPAVDLYEDDQNFYARFTLPGIRKENIQLRAENSTLNLSVEEQRGEGENQQSVQFARSVNLPEGVDRENISARYEDGILTVTLPKEATAQARTIQVS